MSLAQRPTPLPVLPRGEPPPFARRAARVLDGVEAFIGRRALTEAQRRLLLTAAAGLRAQVEEDPGFPFPFLHLAPLLAEGLGAGEDGALPLAVASALVYLAVDTIDDLADGDRPAHWGRYTPGEINLAGATLLCSLPQLALEELDAPAEVRAALQWTLAEGLLHMGAGQGADLAHTGGEEVTPDEVEASVEGKSGEEVATFAALAARYAAADGEVVELCAALGRALGTGGQLASDCYELFTETDCRDLVHGTRTLPVALHLERLPGEERREFLRLLERARSDAAVRAGVRERLRAAGELRRCAFVVEVHCQRALRALDRLPLEEPARSGLRTMIRSISFFSKDDEQ